MEFNSWQINKIAGAVLATLLFVMAVNMLSSALFAPEIPEVPGFRVAVEEVEVEVVEEVVEEIPIATLLAAAAIEDGERAARKCTSCHVFEEGGESRVGPAMWGVLNRPKGAVDGFGYSDAMMAVAANGEIWGYDELNGFLKNPREYLDGTSMGFAGIRSDEERASLILYLRSLAAEPAPLPEIAAVEAEAAPAEAVDGAQEAAPEESAAPQEAVDAATDAADDAAAEAEEATSSD